MMAEEQRSLTVTWKDRDGCSTNRVSVRLRWLQIIAGMGMLAVLGSLVLGAVALRLQSETAELHLRYRVLEAERVRLAERVRSAEEEIGQAREGLARVRTEEAKIRSWLGLEGVEETVSPADAETSAREEGGKGSLGEEGLESVAPRARGTEAEGSEEQGAASIVDESRSLAEDLADLAVYVEKQKEGWDAIPAASPVDGEHWISSAFGWRESPFTGKREFHSGIDMAGRKGTPVVATANGTVYRVFNDPALGKGLSIDHGNGIRTIYGHLERVLVSEGEAVRRGQEIGHMGSSGRRSTGPHLHYALKVDDQYVNPRNYLLDRSRQGTAVARK